jgi:ABC-type branched-subunit amino acid transport system substrate-binding protein
MRNQRSFRIAAVFVALALAGLGACGRSDNSSGGGGASGGTVDPASKTGIGFDGKTITVGIMTPQTGLASAIGLPLTAGNEVFFQRLNDQGGIAGRFKVELKTVDTKYDPIEAVNLYGQLKGQVAMFAQVLGSNVVDALKDQLTTDNILAQPATLDAFWVHEPALMPFGAPYQVQVVNSLDYAIRNLDAKTKKVCSLTKDDPYGNAGKDGYDHALKAFGLTSAADTTYKQGNTDFTAQINTLQSADCGIVSLTSLANETGPIMQAAAARKFEPKWLGTSPSWNVALAGTPQAPSALAPYFEANMMLASEGGDWGDESIPAMKQQMEDVRKYRPNQAPNGYFTFGWNEAWAVQQILEFAAKQGDLTQQGILDASHKIQLLSFGGGYGDYKYGDPKERDMKRQTTMFKINGQKPNATEAVGEKNFVSKAAQDYVFP